MDLTKLHKQLNEFYLDHAKCENLFNNNYIPALINEGLTEEQAKLVAVKAWEDGHSSGFAEVVNVSYDLIDFVQKILKTK